MNSNNLTYHCLELAARVDELRGASFDVIDALGSDRCTLPAPDAIALRVHLLRVANELGAVQALVAERASAA